MMPNLLSVLEVYSSLIIASSLLLALFYGRAHLRQRDDLERRTAAAKIISEVKNGVVFPFFSMKKVSPEQFAAFGEGDIEVQKARNDVLKYINDMEYISLLVVERIADERIVKRYIGREVIKGFDACVFYISMLRERDSNPSVYSAFEALAHKWRSEP